MIEVTYTDLMMVINFKQKKIYQRIAQVVNQPKTNAKTISGASFTQSQSNVAANLPNTKDRVQKIQANLASSTRAEFANVIDQLNASQGKPGKQESGGIVD